MNKQVRKYMIFIPILLAVMVLLLVWLSVPKGKIYGSTTDWASQHVALAETIRTECLEQKTLAPKFLTLGGGSNGFQFSYYGYYRPDILIGCLMPEVPMETILICYMIAGWIVAAWLCFWWLYMETEQTGIAFWGSVIFLTASCFFHTHRQIMFINYMPFLMAALICVRKKKYGLLSLCMWMIILHSFYFSIACFAVIGYYWMRTEGKQFWKTAWLKYIGVSFCGVGMAAMLLLPTAMVLLEQRRSSGAMGIKQILGFADNPGGLLYSPYGIGLTAISLYFLLMGLTGLWRKQKNQIGLGIDSLVLLTASVWNFIPYLLNGTLYMRSKILNPFLPLAVLQCVRVAHLRSKGEMGWRIRQSGRTDRRYVWKIAPFLIVPFLLFLKNAKTEDYVDAEMVERKKGFVESSEFDQMYRFDNRADFLNDANRLKFAGQQKSTMYSSVTNPDYAEVYYNLLKTPIGINNRAALLSQENPFAQYFLGVRYLLTDLDRIPAGYEMLKEYDGQALVENPNVLPIAYTAGEVMSEDVFEQLDETEQLVALMKYSVVPAENTAKEQKKYEVEKLAEEQRKEIKSLIRKWKTVKEIQDVQDTKEEVLVLQFNVKRKGKEAAVLELNGIRNKLSGASAPYPNKNKRFVYAFDGLHSLDEIQVTRKDGNFEISEIEMTAISKDIFKHKEGEREISPAIWKEPNKGEILSCEVTVNEDGWFITSIPKQKGMEIWVDRKKEELQTVNQAFAGARLSKGTHLVQVRFTPPGQQAGMWMSIVSWLIFMLWSTKRIWLTLYNKHRELIHYGFAGVATTVVNYTIYLVMGIFGTHYLLSNTAAWVGAVLFSYGINRLWVFHSNGNIRTELIAFGAARLMTLVIENGCLWLCVEQIGVAQLPAKLAVSVVTVILNYVICKFQIFNRKERV